MPGGRPSRLPKSRSANVDRKAFRFSPGFATRVSWSVLSVVSPDAMVAPYSGTVIGPVTFNSSSIV